MKKRIISALLLGSMLLLLASCGSDKNPAGTSNPDDTTVVKDDSPAGIEKKNYDGEINILVPNWGLYTNFFQSGDDMSDVMNKALYNRETKVEDHLGVDITYQYLGSIDDIAPSISQAVATNDDLYQMALTHCIALNSALITEGNLTDMNRLDIDFTADWFNQASNEALEVRGKQFFAISDYMLPDPNVVLFNKQMIEDLQLEDPYQIVRDKKWTLDKMTEMASAATQDNGDVFWDENDTYGFTAPSGWYLTSFIYGADVPIIEKDEDDQFKLAFGNNKSYTLMEKLDTLLNGPDTYIFEDLGEDGAIPIESGRCLFTLNSFTNFSTLRDVNVDFGILPYPMLDEEQDDYVANDWSGLMCVPYSVPEDSYEMIGDTIELLAYHSEEEVIPTYIEETLGLKLARDEDSMAMIDLIFDSVRFDAAMNYFGLSSGVIQFFYSPQYMIVDTAQNNFASWLATHGPVAETTIENFNEAVLDIEG